MYRLILIVGAVWLKLCASQDSNIIPNLLKPYFWSTDQHLPINLMANVSEKLFHAQKVGLSFEPTMLRPDYDFIIVGGGTAGCVIANRLTENKDWNVLVLEAGRPESLVNLIPMSAGYLIKSQYDWGYVAEKTPGSCIASENERCPYHAGRALGGSSAINYMIYTRGNRRDFDEWEAAGNEGWGYEGVLPYFKKLESASLGEGFNPEYRGSSGPMKVGYPPHRSALSDFLLKSAQDVGHPLVDYNAEQQLGASYVQANIDNGRRLSAASAYIHPIYKSRKNLHIVTGAMVSRVMIDEDTKTAIGVEYKRDGRSYSVYAKKEVILSAGALKSPHLLMLSGIGPRAELERVGIKVIKELPVGTRFYDHNVFGGLIYQTNTTNLAFHIKQLGLLEALEFAEGKGPLTSPVTVETVVYGKMPKSPLHPEQPDYEILFLPTTLGNDLGTSLASAFKVKREIYNVYFGPLESQRRDAFTVFIHQMRPKSFGYMKLVDKNIETDLLFYPNFYTEEYDIEAQLAGIKEGMRIASSPIMQSIGAQIYSNPIPGCEHLKFASDGYWRCALRVAMVGTHHQTGSCRMGPEDSKEAIVDNKLRVHGIKRLRVADNSIIPNMICAHTHAVALMIGEKFSDILKEDWLGR